MTKFRIKVISHRDALLNEVVTLGTKNSKTLGLFPEGAFIDHAKKQTIIVALAENDALAGYVLFRISQRKRFVSIAHLCIHENSQKMGVAFLLLNAVIDRFKNHLKCISLTCREDYVAPSQLWEKFGFKPRQRKRSRSVEEKYLVTWIYDFGNPDLFSQPEIAGDRIKAVMDTSVIIPINDPPSPFNTEAHSLKADWLQEEAEFLYAPEIYNEVNRDGDKIRAGKTLASLKKYDKINYKPETSDKFYKELQEVKHGTTPNDISDRKQLAETIASGIRYFVTLDDEIIDLAEELYQRYQLSVLRPVDFVLLIDELSNTFDYHSLRLAGANYEQGRIKPNEIESLVKTFCGVNGGEREHELRTRISKCAQDPKKGTVRAIKDKGGKRIGLYGVELCGNLLSVKLIRVTKGTIANTLFQQIIRDIILDGLERNAEIVEITEEGIPPTQQTILAAMGFMKVGDGWKKIALKGVYSLEQLFDNPVISSLELSDFVLDQFRKISPARKNVVLAELERKIWPAKIDSLDLPVYIVPIRPTWASQLFDFHIAGADLFGARETLVWSRENIYYRNVKPVSERSPGRILWYLSSDSRSVTGRAKAIVACSYLDDVYVDRATSIFKKYRHFGVYEWSDIYKLANGENLKEIKALKFSDTEVFKNIVPLDKITDVMIKNGRPKNTFTSPVEVSTQIFFDIYSLAHDDKSITDLS